MTTTNRTIVVTGAASGIGAAIVKAFLDEGDIVYASDRSAERLSVTAKELDAGERLVTTIVDVTDHDEVVALAERAKNDRGEIHAWVNCAGVFDGYADIEETSPKLWDKVMSINLTGTYNTARAATLQMKDQGHGRIILIGSVAGQRGAADGLSYVTSKAGIDGLNRRLAIDVGKYGMTSNVIAPGVIVTDLRGTSEEVLGDLVSDQNRGIGVSGEDFLKFLIPAQRKAQPSEVASVAVFLASDGAGYVNGQTLAVDGGWTAV